MHSARRRSLLLLAVLGLVAALTLVEAALHLRGDARRSRLEPGLVRYDSLLGWRLSPSWSGTHRSADYDTLYRVGPDGFRQAPPPATPSPLWVVLGDSFTFGLGVADEETFTCRLGQAAGSRARFVNAGIPGYSTDQEWLLARNEVLPVLKPEGILLVVCLLNDLADNSRGIPLQANRPKPYAVLTPEGVAVRNVPVPAPTSTAPKPPGRTGGGWLGAMRRSRLAERLARGVRRPEPAPESSAAAISNEVALAQAIIGELQRDCDAHGCSLRVALLPGRSWFAARASPSARYQDRVRRQLAASLAHTGVVIDLAERMARNPRAGKEEWYFRRDGHLTPAGHRVVAEELAQALGGEGADGGP